MIEQEGIKVDSKWIDKETRIKLISISGYVDQANCHILQKTIDKCLNEECYNLVFDFQNLVYMSSAGWGVLIGEIKRFRENGGDIKLANMGPEIYEIYQMLEFYHIISEYPNVEDAVKSFDLGVDVNSIEQVIPVAQNDNPPAEEFPLPEEPGLITPLESAEEGVTETNEHAIHNDEPISDAAGTPEITEEDIDVNFDDMLANEGIERTTRSVEDGTYVAFETERYKRKLNPQIMPVPDKIRTIVAEHPEYSTRKIRKALRRPEYGNVKIGFFRLRKLLKDLDLDTKEKRYRFYRSA